MAGRMHGKNVQMQGSIAFTEKQVSVGYRNFFQLAYYDFHLHNRYVLQTDFLLPYLTVRETLQFAAALRLPASMSKQGKHDRVCYFFHSIRAKTHSYR
jgi:ABC-type multidrug transport system ATPase subunit